MDQNTLQQLKNTLEEEREKLISGLKSIAVQDPQNKNNWITKPPQFEPNEYGSHTSLEEEAEEVEEYESLLEAEHSLESRLLQVNMALLRIEKNTYGRCGKCGKELSPERLRANPSAEFDVEHSK